MWMRPDQPRTGRTVLRVKVVDGRVVAEIEDPAAPDEFRVRRPG
jgi:hypothetical protein